ncbi:hypothetical protein Z052_01960 [Halorubrum sp. C191]|nr:hypothetical protein Z052_01960 [Halorubrum sp. C191]
MKHDGEAYYLTGEDTENVRRLSTQAKSTITRRANEFRTEQEAAVLRRLKRREPLRATPDADPDAESLVVAFGDVHMGDLITAGGREVYNPRIAYGSVLEITRRTLEIKDMMESMTDIDTVHVLWLGDMVTGERVYDGQEYNITLLLADQLAMSVEVLTHQIETFSEHFDTVTVTAVPGNHGLDKASAKSQQANQDLNCYRWTVDRLHEAGVDNVDFRISNGGHYANREIRGHNYHIRHGQDEQIHADATARSEADQRGLLYAHDYDVQVRGHFHTSRQEEVLNTADVVTLPSPKPGDDFAERIGRPDVHEFRALGKLWRVSDRRPMAGVHKIDDIDMDLDALDVPSIDDIRQRYNKAKAAGPHVHPVS